jgi:phytoene synthase
MTTALVQVSTAEVARTTIAHHSKSFALASRLLEARTRDHTAVVYSYCRRVDDLVDERPGDGGPAIAMLEAELDDCYRGQPRDEMLAAFAAVVKARDIPERYPRELVAGMAMDVDDTRYRTMAELHTYCYRVAGVVGLMMSHVFGVRGDRALVPAARLGIAMQLTNICRDVAEDWRRRRLYLPDELLARHGAAGLAGDLDGRELPRTALPALAAAVRELLALADTHYRAADRGIPDLPWRAALAVRAARSVYSAIGSRIAATGYDVSAGRAVVSRRRKLAHVAGAATRALFAAPVRAFAPRAAVPTRILEVGDVPIA